jgi:hypothetical protein
MSFPNIVFWMTYSIHPTHKQTLLFYKTLLFYSTIFKIWRSLGFRAKPFQTISSFGKFCQKRFLYDEFQTCSFIHVNLDSILCGKEYSKNILSTSSKDSFKNSIMFTCSCSPPHVHKITLLSSENNYSWMKKIHTIRIIGNIV